MEITPITQIGPGFHYQPDTSHSSYLSDEGRIETNEGGGEKGDVQRHLLWSIRFSSKKLSIDISRDNGLGVM